MDVQVFCKAAKIVIPWAKEDKDKVLNFVELAPFIFNMSDETFGKWMQIHEKSRTGDLIAYNAMKQKELEARVDRETFMITKRNFRDFQGLTDEGLSKLADYLLVGKKVSLAKDKPSTANYDMEQEGKWVALKDYV